MIKISFLNLKTFTCLGRDTFAFCISFQLSHYTSLFWKFASHWNEEEPELLRFYSFIICLTFILFAIFSSLPWQHWDWNTEHESAKRFSKPSHNEYLKLNIVQKWPNLINPPFSKNFIYLSAPQTQLFEAIFLEDLSLCTLNRASSVVLAQWKINSLSTWLSLVNQQSSNTQTNNLIYEIWFR